MDKIKRLEQTASKLLSRYKSPNFSRELTNQDVKILLFQYALKGRFSEASIDDLEGLHEKLALLTQQEMRVIDLKYFQGRSLRAIGRQMNSHHHTIARLEQKALRTLKKL